MRVVSCVPSLSELAEELAPGCLVGRTRFCIAPDYIRNVPVIGGTKNLNTGAILKLQPDLVLAVKEENEKDQIEYLQSQNVRTEVFDVRTLEDAADMAEHCGYLLGNSGKGAEISAAMRAMLKQKPFFSGRILYFIWQNPWMVAGPDTFIGNLLKVAGFHNLAPEGGRYPILENPEQIRKLGPELILLSSEPFPFREEHREFFRNNFPDSSVYCVDGSVFSWYGSRTLQLPVYLQHLFA